MCKDFDGQDACQWGWQKVENKMIPLWTDLSQALNICTELVKCGCRKECTGQCKCLISNLKCTELCQCFGQCANGKPCCLMQMLYWFCEKSTGWYYKGVSKTTTTYKVEHYMKNDEIQVFSNPCFPIFGQNRKTGKIRKNTDAILSV